MPFWEQGFWDSGFWEQGFWEGMSFLSGGVIVEQSHTTTTASISSVSAATGGVDPVTYQWQRKQGAGAYADVVGATLAALTDAGLEPATEYTFKRIATDSVGSIAESNAVTLTTDAAPAEPLGFASCTISYAGTDSQIPVYDVGDVVPIIATFTNTETGERVDPDVVSFELKLPGDVTLAQPLISYVFTTDPELERESIGRYRVNFPVTMAGKHHIKFMGTVTWVVTTVGEFNVIASRLH